MEHVVYTDPICYRYNLNVNTLLNGWLN